MTKYEKYLKSVEEMQLPSSIALLDMRAEIAYAKKRGIAPSDLSDEEARRFIISR